MRNDLKGNLTRQMVVVAELNFFNGHRVVFIDDGNDASEVSSQGISRRKKSLAVLQIIMGQRDLGRRQLIMNEFIIPQGHQTRLTNSRTGL